MKDFIPVNTPLLDGNEKKYLLACIEEGWISSEGPYVAEFEKRFAQRVGRRHAIAVTNGTAAIDAAVEALGIGPGDEVIMPTFTIISCVLQIVRAGAIPVLVDSDPVTFNMEVSAIEAKISSRTRAIMVAHMYGLPVDMDPVLALACKHNLKIIEDAAEMHGQTYRGKACGSFGDISTFSFYPNKHVTSGEGGMIVTDDDALAASCRSLRNLCFEPGRRFVHERLGWNLRMTNLQAAVGVAQLERLDEFVGRKRRMGALYDEALAGVKGVRKPLAATGYAQNIYWVYPLVLEPSSGLTAETAMAKLAERGIGTRPFFYPMHLQPVLRRMGLFQGQGFPVAEHLATYGFYVPSGMALTEDQIRRSAAAVADVLSGA